MKNIIIFPHLGIGDQFVINGYVNYILTKYQPHSITIVARRSSKYTFEHLYSDNNNVYFLYMDNDKQIGPLKENLNKMKDVTVTYFGQESDNLHFLHTYFWADSFYIQGDIDPEIRFTHFSFPSNLDTSLKNYEILKKNIGDKKYIIVHDDPSRNFKLNPLKLENRDKFVTVYLGIDREKYEFLDNSIENVVLSNKDYKLDSLLNLYHIIQNAEEAHLMDSSIAIMADYIPNKVGRFYSHVYIRGVNTQNLYKGEWIFIK